MTEKCPVVITISRLLGSGGSFLGQQLARRLGYRYADHEILQLAAVELGNDVEQLTERDETSAPFWEMAMSYFYAGAADTTYQPSPPMQFSTDREIYQAENAIIARLAQEENAIIVGHGGFFVLRNHPRHISLFLHAPLPFRIQRIQSLYQVTAQEAEEMIVRTDCDRERYVHALCGQQRTDLRNYHLTLDTSTLSLPEVEELLFGYIQSRTRE